MKCPLYFFLSLMAFTIFLGCKKDAKTNEDILWGRWEIVDASRNGSRTETLDELYFVFGEDGSLETNIAGSPEMATYSVKENLIQQRESRLEADYLIEQITDSTLMLATELRTFRFRLLLKKVDAAPQVEE